MYLWLCMALHANPQRAEKPIEDNRKGGDESMREPMLSDPQFRNQEHQQQCVVLALLERSDLDEEMKVARGDPDGQAAVKHVDAAIDQALAGDAGGYMQNMWLARDYRRAFDLKRKRVQRLESPALLNVSNLATTLT